MKKIKRDIPIPFEVSVNGNYCNDCRYNIPHHLDPWGDTPKYYGEWTGKVCGLFLKTLICYTGPRYEEIRCQECIDMFGTDIYLEPKKEVVKEHWQDEDNTTTEVERVNECRYDCAINPALCRA